MVGINLLKNDRFYRTIGVIEHISGDTSSFTSEKGEIYLVQFLGVTGTVSSGADILSTDIFSISIAGGYYSYVYSLLIKATATTVTITGTAKFVYKLS